jgi:hypothetical protein
MRHNQKERDPREWISFSVSTLVKAYFHDMNVHAVIDSYSNVRKSGGYNCEGT